MLMVESGLINGSATEALNAAASRYSYRSI
jgi:hypothetical protein